MIVKMRINCGKMKKVPCVILFILLYLVYAVQGQNQCTQDFGEDNPDGKDIIGGPLTDMYFLACSGMYVSTCCSIIDRWRLTAEITGQPVELMIWRPTTGSMYELVSSFTITPTNTGKTEYATTKDTLIREGDCIGWHATGEEVINFKRGGKGIQASYMTIAGGVTEGTETDWSGATLDANSDSEWGIEVEVKTSTDPTYTTTVLTYNIPETTAVDALVADITFTDTDYNDKLTITSIASRTGYFTVTDKGDFTANVTVAKALTDINSMSTTIDFTATDLCGRTATGSITINVINTPPNLLNLVPGSDVSESLTVETLVTQFICNDTSGNVELPVVTWTPTNPAGTLFFTKWVSGDEYGIYTNGGFSFATQQSYSLSVKCSDGIVADDVTDVTNIYVKRNSPPVITNLPINTTVSVDQSTNNGTVVFNISYTDDESDQVFLSYTCDKTPCVVRVLDSGQVQAVVDFIDAAHTGYDIFIDIRDQYNNGIQRTLTLTISGINDTPWFRNMPNSASVNENVAIGTTVFQVSYDDDDANDTHTFYWTNADGGNALFNMNTSTGVVTTVASLNYEALSPKVYPFVVVLSDGTASVTSTVTITINNVNEPLTWNSAVYRTDVTERAAISTIVTNPGFAITDPDTGDAYTCYMDCGATHNGYYIMSSSCVITVQAMYTLDTGNSNTVVCTVTAVDNGPHTATTTLTITVGESNDFTPTFGVSNYGFSVSHYDTVGTALGSVTATDGDIGTYGGFSYSLDQSGLTNSFFMINAGTGAISTQMAMSVCNCSGTTLVVPVIATDNGGRSSTATVYVTVGVSTTTVTTTTQDWYIGFFDDQGNLVWFCLAMALLAVVTVVGVFICLKYVCMWKGTCCKFKGPRKWKPGRSNFDRPRMGGGPKPDRPSMVQCRLPPPPSDMHGWKQAGRGLP